MMAAVPKLSYAVSQYASHSLRANVYFPNIEKNMQEIKTDPSIIYMFPDHKQKVLQLKSREGQVDYYGKKGVSFLGFM